MKALFRHAGGGRGEISGVIHGGDVVDSGDKRGNVIHVWETEFDAFGGISVLMALRASQLSFVKCMETMMGHRGIH